MSALLRRLCERRVALSTAVATAMVVLIASLMPRSYIANDDIGLTEFLRENTLAPWISPLLSQLLGFAYLHAPDVPWYGLYLYAMLIFIGAVLIHSLLEQLDVRDRPHRSALAVAAVLLALSHAIIVVGITWTTVAISSAGTALAAFVAHALICQASGRPVSRGRALVYGLLFANGYMLRPQGLGGVLVALAPLLIWTAWRFFRSRYAPRPLAVLALVGPCLLAMTIQKSMPQTKDPALAEFDRFNYARGMIHGNAAYTHLDTRAPELLERAGWSKSEFKAFENWLILDEAEFPTEKIDRLVATGGVPEQRTLEWNYRQLRTIVAESAPSVYLFVTLIATGVVLAILGLIPRWRAIGFSVGYGALMLAIPLWMAASYRFPQRVALSMYTLAALGLFVYLARLLAERVAAEALDGTVRRRRAPAMLIGVTVIAFLVVGWARHMGSWMTPPTTTPHRASWQALEDRIAERDGFVFCYVQAGLLDLDPMRARPRSYEALQGGWGTFSIPWYRTIRKLGITRGADILTAMVDNPDAYLLSMSWGREALEEYIRSKVGNQVRLAVIDAAGHRGARPELYRLVTTPMAEGDEEWALLERDRKMHAGFLPPVPVVGHLSFAPIHADTVVESEWRREGVSRVVVTPIDGGIRTLVIGDEAGNVKGKKKKHFGGVMIPVRGMEAIRFELTLIDPANISGVYVYGRAGKKSVRWRWPLTVEQRELGYAGPITLVTGVPSRHLALAVSEVEPEEIDEFHLVIRVLDDTSAGFELRRLELSEP